MKTINYNPETHVLVPRDLIADAKQIFCSDVEPNTNGDCLDVIEWFSAMIAAAPQPESVDGKPVEYLLDGARFKLSFQEIGCDECGTESPYVLVTPLDHYANELNGKWVALVPAENDRHLHIAAQPDRVAELEAALKVARDALDHARLFIRNGIGLGYIRMPDDDCPDPAKSVPGEIFEALAKINEVLHD